MELGLRGKRALVTAASRGLGRAVAESLLAEECRVCVTSSSEPSIAAAAREMAKAGGEVHALAADLGRYHECDRLFAWATSTLGGLDILINNTVGPPTGGVLELSDDQWRESFDLIFMSALRLSRAAIPVMREDGGGSIVNLASLTAKQPIDGIALSNALRPALVGMAPYSPFDFRQELEEFIELAQRRALGPSTAALVRAAEERDIPWIRLNEGALVQLGYGKYQKRIQATLTSETRQIATEIASDKRLTQRILEQLGLPVPRQSIVCDPQEAAEEAERLGFPVVVKPLDGHHGQAVATNLKTHGQVREAYEKARKICARVIVEAYQTGNDYRILVIDGRVVAVAQRVPGHVVGNGKSTIAELIEEVNRDPRRGIGHEKVLTRIKVDEAAIGLLADQGYKLGDVPPAGEMVKLTLTGNMSTGGISIDRTFEAHPENVEIAEEAARMVGLDIAGIDFICPDITEGRDDTLCRYGSHSAAMMSPAGASSCVLRRIVDPACATATGSGGRPSSGSRTASTTRRRSRLSRARTT